MNYKLIVTLVLALLAFSSFAQDEEADREPPETPEFELPLDIGPVTIDEGPFGGYSATDNSGTFGIEVDANEAEWYGPIEAKPAEAKAVVFFSIHF